MNPHRSAFSYVPVAWGLFCFCSKIRWRSSKQQPSTCTLPSLCHSWKVSRSVVSKKLLFIYFKMLRVLFSHYQVVKETLCSVAKQFQQCSLWRKHRCPLLTEALAGHAGLEKHARAVHLVNRLMSSSGRLLKKKSPKGRCREGSVTERAWPDV